MKKTKKPTNVSLILKICPLALCERGLLFIATAFSHPSRTRACNSECTRATFNFGRSFHRYSRRGRSRIFPLFHHKIQYLLQPKLVQGCKTEEAVLTGYAKSEELPAMVTIVRRTDTYDSSIHFHLWPWP